MFPDGKDCRIITLSDNDINSAFSDESDTSIPRECKATFAQLK